MNASFRLTPLRWSVFASLILHAGFLAWASGWSRPSEEPDVESLRLVQVDPTVTPPVPPEEVAPLPVPSPPAAVLPNIVRHPSLPKPVKPPAEPVKPLPRIPPPARPPERTVPRSAPHVRNPIRNPAPLPRTALPSRAAPPIPKSRVVAAGPASRPVQPMPLPPPKSALPEGNPGAGTGSDAGGEDVPDGPVDLQPVKDDDGAAAQTTKITRGAMIQSNPNVKGEIGVALARVLPPFNGPGVFYTTTLDVPASAPPGTVYTLDFTNVVIAGEHGKLDFTPVSGTLTVVPTKSPLPPVEQPSLSGDTIGVGHLYAHRGTKVTVEVFAGDGLKGVAGVQAKLKFREIKIGKRKKTTTTSDGPHAPPAKTENPVPPLSTNAPG